MTQYRTKEGWKRVFKDAGALWTHDGNPNHPHVELTSGLHSGGYFDAGRFMEDPVLAGKAAHDLVASLWEAGFKSGEVDRVVGPAMGAVTLAHDLAREISEQYGDDVHSGYCEKYKDPATGIIRMIFKRTRIVPGERVFICEDVLTTGGSIELVAQAVEEKGGIVLPFVLVLLDRRVNDLPILDGRRIIPLVSHPMPVFEADACELCKLGSRPQKTPKENWEMFTIDQGFQPERRN